MLIANALSRPDYAMMIATWLAIMYPLSASLVVTLVVTQVKQLGHAYLPITGALRKWPFVHCISSSV